MLQIYFLSVAANALAGAILASDWLSTKFSGIRALAGLVSGRRGKLALGLAALFVGLVTLIFPAEPPVLIGDLAPSLVGLAMGVALLFEVLRQEALFPAERVDGAEKPGRVPEGFRTTLGLLGLVTALVHFFLPERLIL